MLIKGFGIDKATKHFINWVREYSPPPLQVQISNYSAVAGVLCVLVGVYLGCNVAVTTIALPPSLAGWLGILPQFIGYLIKGATNLMVIGVIIVLLGRAARWYFERDVKLLRNAALIVTIGWFGEILYATSDVLINPKISYDKLIFSIIIGILIAIASVLVVLVIHRSAKGFFEKTGEKVEDFGEN
jgi:uncharacterized membrane protein